MNSLEWVIHNEKRNLLQSSKVKHIWKINKQRLKFSWSKSMNHLIRISTVSNRLFTGLPCNFVLSEWSWNDGLFSSNYLLLFSSRKGPNFNIFEVFDPNWTRKTPWGEFDEQWGKQMFTDPHQSNSQNWCWNAIQLWFLFALFRLFLQYHAGTAHLIRLLTPPHNMRPI